MSRDNGRHSLTQMTTSDITTPPTTTPHITASNNTTSHDAASHDRTSHDAASYSATPRAGTDSQDGRASNADRGVLDLEIISRIADPVQRSRLLAARSLELLRASTADTFLGRGVLKSLRADDQLSADGANPLPHGSSADGVREQADEP